MTLDTGFEAMGFSAGVGIGLSWLWVNGWYVEYAMFGIGKTKLLSKSAAIDDDSLSIVFQEDLEGMRSWGFANLSVGYQFQP